MGKLSQKTSQFFFRNRDKGIPNLMLWIVIANVIVYIINYTDPNQALYNILCFSREKILQGQVWRLFSYILLELCSREIVWAAIAAIFYYQMGRALEGVWGTFKFNLYYLTGIIAMDIAGMLFGYASINTVHNTLFLAYATLYPDATFLILFIIPIKARWLGLISLVLSLIELLSFSYFPYNLFPLFALANYFLYFGKDFVNIFPVSWRLNFRRLFRRKKTRTPNTVPFPKAGSYEATHASPQAPYTHKCTVCGRTDVTNPELEFRYCSRCKGYYCYCVDHINNHTHIE